MLEFSNSMIRSNKTLPIKQIFSTTVTEEKTAAGTRNKARNSSCLKALSSLKANTNPERLFTKAKISLLKPLFFL